MSIVLTRASSAYCRAKRRLTDPQQRIFLEIAWEALEDAGYDPAQVAGPVGVFAGTSMNTYFLKHVLTDRSVIDEFTSQFQIGEYQKLVGAGDFVATRTAYKLGLRGPRRFSTNGLLDLIDRGWASCAKFTALPK